MPKKKIVPHHDFSKPEPARFITLTDSQLKRKKDANARREAAFSDAQKKRRAELHDRNQKIRDQRIKDRPPRPAPTRPVR